MSSKEGESKKLSGVSSVLWVTGWIVTVVWLGQPLIPLRLNFAIWWERMNSVCLRELRVLAEQDENGIKWPEG